MRKRFAVSVAAWLLLSCIVGCEPPVSGRTAGDAGRRDARATIDDDGGPLVESDAPEGWGEPDAPPLLDIDGGGVVVPPEEPPPPDPPPPVDPPPPPGPCTFAGEEFTLRHLQASMQRTDPAADRSDSIDAAFEAGAHTISWTEVENIAMARRIEARAGWRTFWPSGNHEDVVARNYIPISWRRDTWEFERGDAWFASEGMAEVSPARFVVRVWLRHRLTGRVHSRVSHHAVSGVDGDGVAPVDWRRRMHARDIDKFREVMNFGMVPVIGSGDFNTTRLRSLLGDAFRYDVPDSGGSHGDRLIDWVVRRPHREYDFVESRFIRLGTSDHRGVRSTYTYRPRCD